MENKPFPGDGACAHPAFEPEYYLGTPTSDYVCTLCGRSFSYEYMRLILKRARANAARIIKFSIAEGLAYNDDRKIREARPAP
jgi:hypothetical protein